VAGCLNSAVQFVINAAAAVCIREYFEIVCGIAGKVCEVVALDSGCHVANESAIVFRSSVNGIGNGSKTSRASLDKVAIRDNGACSVSPTYKNICFRISAICSSKISGMIAGFSFIYCTTHSFVNLSSPGAGVSNVTTHTSSSSRSSDPDKDILRRNRSASRSIGEACTVGASFGFTELKAGWCGDRDISGKVDTRDRVALGC